LADGTAERACYFLERDGCFGSWVVKTQEVEKPRRRWLQFSLRGLLVLMVVVALGLGWIANERREVWLENRAVEEIERLGGDVTRGDNSKSSHNADDPFGGPIPEGLSWQQRLFGESYNRPVVCVSFPPGTGPEALGSLKRLRAIWAIGLTGARIGDEQIPHLLECRDLTAVHMNATDVTDDGVKQLATLPDLDTLLLDHTGVTDDVLAALSQKALIDISIRDTDITPEGAARLAKSQPHPEADFSYAPSPSRSHREAAKRLIRLGADVDTWWPDGEDRSRAAVTDVSIGDSVHWGGDRSRWAGKPGDLQHLAKLSGIGTVSLVLGDIEGDYLSELARLDVTPRLAINAWSVASESLPCLSSMKTLVDLRLQTGTLTAIPQIENLRVLELEMEMDESKSPEIPLVALKPLAGCGKLRNLALSGMTLPSGAFRLLSECIALESLALYDVDISSCDQRQLRNIKNLRSLTIHSEPWEPAARLALIGAIPQLQTLDLRHTEVSSEDLRILCQCPHLRRLSVNFYALGDVDVKQLSTLKHLEYLDLGQDTSILDSPNHQNPKECLTEAAFGHLRRMPRLREVNLPEVRAADLPFSRGVGLVEIVAFEKEIRDRSASRDRENVADN
jgi:internalin A